MKLQEEKSVNQLVECYKCVSLSKPSSSVSESALLNERKALFNIINQQQQEIKTISQREEQCNII